MLLIGTVETASTLTTRCYLSEELIRVADEARYAAYLAGLEERRGKAVGEMKDLEAEIDARRNRRTSLWVSVLSSTLSARALG